MACVMNSAFWQEHHLYAQGTKLDFRVLPENYNVEDQPRPGHLSDLVDVHLRQLVKYNPAHTARQLRKLWGYQNHLVARQVRKLA